MGIQPNVIRDGDSYVNPFIDDPHHRPETPVETATPA
jgi:hypothetical protein